MNAIRFIQYLIIANALLLIIQTVRVIAIYSAVYSLTKDQGKKQLPLHVWLIATSYLIYVLGTTYFLYINGAQYQSLSRAIVYGTSGLIGQYALWNVLQYDRRRLSEATSFQDDE